MPGECCVQTGGPDGRRVTSRSSHPWGTAGSTAGRLTSLLISTCPPGAGTFAGLLPAPNPQRCPRCPQVRVGWRGGGDAQPTSLFQEEETGS